MMEPNIRFRRTKIWLPGFMALGVLASITGCNAQLTLSRSPPASNTLASVPSPYGIAVDATTVYVTQYDPAPLLAVPITSGPATPVGVQAAGRPIAVDGQRLYWTAPHALLSCEKTDCAATTVTVARVTGDVSDVQVDATAVYWAEIDTTGTGTSQVMRMDKDALPLMPADGGAMDGGASVPLPVQISTADWPANIAIDGVSIYWLEVSTPAGVWKAPLAGGPSVQVTAGGDDYELMGLAVDAENVYFANGAGTVFKAPKTGGAPMVVISGLGQFPAGLATDETDLYVAASTRIVSRPLAGGPVRTLAVGLAGAGSIALDATSVYVTDRDANSVVKVAKPSAPTAP